MTVKKEKKIVSLGDRIRNKKLLEEKEKNQGKVETIRSIVQCASCHMKCAMCGLHLDRPDMSSESRLLSLGLVFCKSCGDEYKDFMANIEGEKGTKLFWHNKEWLDMWSAWLSYRKSVKAFINSPEFQLLLNDINQQQ